MVSRGTLRNVSSAFNPPRRFSPQSQRGAPRVAAGKVGLGSNLPAQGREQQRLESGAKPSTACGVVDGKPGSNVSPAIATS